MLKKYILVVFSLLLVGLNSIQSKAVEVFNDLEFWSLNTLVMPVPKTDNKFKLYAEIQPRVGDDFSEFNRLLIRPALGYQVNKNLSLWQGYGWTPTFQAFKSGETILSNVRHENRIWQQALLQNKVKNLTIVNRTRLEERFIEDTSGPAFRARHMLRLSHPIPKTKKWSAVIYDEAFVHLNSVDRGPRAGFDQNRLFIGANRKINNNVNIEGGYMANFINTPPGNRERLNHIIMTGVNFTF